MLARFKTEFRDQIWNNEQVLKIRQRFAELDTQTQSYILIGGFASFVLFLLLTFFTLWGRAIYIKNELASMDEQIRYAQTAGVKIEELRSRAQSQGSEPLLEEIDLEAPVDSFLERATQKSMIAKGNVEVMPPNGNVGEVKLSRISLTQLVRMLYIIEESGAGASVEKLNVDAKTDLEGFLWATITVRKSGDR
jgi:hypothetical protein